MTQPEIENLIERFATSARIAQKTGFSGAQIHGAHGYLVSQFLSPHHNQRTDQWGGSLENRARFVLEVLKAMRAATGPAFPLSIKMNSADFQRGGFTEEESMQVAEMLAAAGIDLIEISGGTYEAPEMTGIYAKESTLAREAYFLEYAEKIRARVKTPLMVTGGFRSLDGMAAAVQSGATDMVGIARPLAVVPDLPQRLLNGSVTRADIKRRLTGIKAIDDMAMMETAWYTKQLERIAKGEPTKPDEHPLLGFLRYVSVGAVRGFKTQRMRAG